MAQNPPVIELVFSVQFEPLSRFNSGVFGRFWDRYFADWEYFAEEDPLDDKFERFDDAGMIAPEMLKILRTLPKPRHVLINRAFGQLLQVQQSRFVLNWRKGDSCYPNYGPSKAAFFDHLNSFCKFVSDQKIGELTPNQWELTYVDFFPLGLDWERLEQWSEIVPGLFSDIGNRTGLRLSNRNANWSFDLPDLEGRLHLSAHRGIVNIHNEKLSGLVLNHTARGPVHNLDSLRSKFDLAHDVLVTFFQKVVSKRILERC